MRNILIALLTMLAVRAGATDLREIKVTVMLQDNAQNGCWTNLKEVREYAEEKLRMQNIQLGNFDFPDFLQNQFWLWIDINADRTQSGSCTGYSNIALNSFFWLDEQVYTINRESHLVGLFIPGTNMNNEVLDTVKTFFSKLK